MKQYFGLSRFSLGICAAFLLAACHSTPQPVGEAQVVKVGMANPASEFCVQQGGSLELKRSENGESGYCNINGQVIEEWEYFRSQQAKCDADEAEKLVGQGLLTEAQIKSTTKANIVRQLEPNQPMTMDYREDRVTVVFDPATQKIVRANCG